MCPSSSRSRPRTVGLILFDGVTLMDVAGPMEVFATANAIMATAAAYRLRTYGVGTATVRSEAGVTLVPDAPLPTRPTVDTLLVPGGSGLRRPEILARVARTLADARPRCRRIVSICTGAYAIAESGLAKRRRIATHWRFSDDLARRYPDVEVDARSLFIRDNGLASSAGITAGIDLCLALVEEDLGHATALAVARELVVYMRRSGGQDQYSVPLQLQSGVTDRIGDLVTDMLARPEADLRLEALAERAHLSPRQLQRRVAERYHCSVTDLIARIRIQEAQRLLCGRHSISEVASRCGYADIDAFSRAFLRRTGMRPSQWRARFAERFGAHTEPCSIELEASE